MTSSSSRGLFSDRDQQPKGWNKDLFRESLSFTVRVKREQYQSTKHRPRRQPRACLSAQHSQTPPEFPSSPSPSQGMQPPRDDPASPLPHQIHAPALRTPSLRAALPAPAGIYCSSCRHLRSGNATLAHRTLTHASESNTRLGSVLQNLYWGDWFGVKRRFPPHCGLPFLAPGLTAPPGAAAAVPETSPPPARGSRKATEACFGHLLSSKQKQNGQKPPSKRASSNRS